MILKGNDLLIFYITTPDMSYASLDQLSSPRRLLEIMINCRYTHTHLFNHVNTVALLTASSTFNLSDGEGSLTLVSTWDIVDVEATSTAHILLNCMFLTEANWRFIGFNCKIGEIVL